MVDELELLKRFRAFLRSDHKEVFDDLLNECRLDGSYAGTMASPVKEVPLLMCTLFGQHKRIMELEKKVNVQRRGECQHTVTKTEVKKAAGLSEESLSNFILIKFNQLRFDPPFIRPRL